MNGRVNIASVVGGGKTVSPTDKRLSTAGFCSVISLREDTGWGLKHARKNKDKRSNIHDRSTAKI